MEGWLPRHVLYHEIQLILLGTKLLNYFLLSLFIISIVQDISDMKKLFLAAVVLSSFALASCGDTCACHTFSSNQKIKKAHNVTSASSEKPTSQNQ